MAISTEPIGSIPRSPKLLAGMQQAAEGGISEGELEALFDQAVRSTITELEATGSPFADDASTARETAFAKIRARIEGTELASERLGA
jgi:5-methyltetrahydropteroyltriglutamate--homocysteine methyltransferase